MKINLGGGNEKKEGYINIDLLAYPTVDIVHDINQGIPLENDSVEEIVSTHCLEHLEDTIRITEEMYRVCRHGAVLKIKVPYFKSIGAFKDPSHKQFFTERTFDYFDPDRCREQDLPNYGWKATFKIEKVAYVWSAEWIRFLPFKRFFLRHCWNIARSIYYELRVVKE